MEAVKQIGYQPRLMGGQVCYVMFAFEGVTPYDSTNLHRAHVFDIAIDTVHVLPHI